MIKIDGSHGEGGGQVLRTSLTLAVLTGQAVRVERIRAGRKKPGLRPQHLTAVRAAAAICDGQLEGDKLGSQELTFVPGGSARPGEYVFDVAEAAQGGSAGSVGLVLQTVLLPLAFADGDSHLTLRGGTHVSWAPSAAYVAHVFLPALARMGVCAQVEVARWGFYPAGGGEMKIKIQGRTESLSSIQIAERGELERAWGTAAVLNLPAHIPQRMANRVKNVLTEADIQARVEPQRLRGTGPGAGIFLFTQYAATLDGASITAGFTAYGRKGLPAERVAEAACEDLLTHHHTGAPVDPHLADQLVLPMALAEKDSHLSTSQITQHLLTNVWVVRKFLAREIKIQGELGSPGTLSVKSSLGFHTSSS